MRIGAVLTAAELEGVGPRADWARWIERGRTPDSGEGAGFTENTADDLLQLNTLGIEEALVTLEWSRLQPTPGGYDDVEVEARRQLLETVRRSGIEPVGCLVDGTLPGWFADDEGGFADDRARTLLWPRHIDWIGETFGDLLAGWVPQREPVRRALRGHLWGVAPPGRSRRTEAAEQVRSVLLAEAEAWRLLRGTLPVATFQTARSFHAEADDVKAGPVASWLDRLMFDAFMAALVDGELSVGDLPSHPAPALRDAFDRIIVQLRPPLLVDATGRATPFDAPLPEAMGESLARTVDAAGERQVVAAADLAPIADDGRARIDHLDALLEIAVANGVAAWWQASPIDGWCWEHGFTVEPGIIDRDRRPHPASAGLRRLATDERPIDGVGSGP